MLGSMDVPHSVGLLLLVGLAGCAARGDAPGDSNISPSSPVVMPTLERVAFKPDTGSSPFGKVPIAADPSGGIYYYGRTNGTQLLTRLDSSGTAIARFGSAGAGPGELSGAGVLLSSGDTLAVYDTRKAALVLFGPAGGVRGEFRLEALGFPLALDGDRLFTSDLDAPLRHEPPAIVESRLGSDSSSIFLGEGDRAFVDAIVPDPSSSPSHLPIPVFTVRGTRSAIGNPRTGRVTVWDGAASFTLRPPGEAPKRGPRGLEETRAALEASLNQLTPAGPARSRRNTVLRERLDTLAREQLPWFLWPGLQFDDHGRLWIFSDRDDSTSVDVFAGERHLGRLTLPCYHPDKWVSLTTGWLALQCKGDPEADVPYELQLYRVEG